MGSLDSYCGEPTLQKKMSSKVVQIAAVLSLLLSLGESNAPPFAGSLGECGEMPDPDDVPDLVAWTYCQMKNYFTEDPGVIPKTVRLAFHHCMGGCNGCIAVDAVLNRGLVWYIQEQDGVWKNLGLSEGAMSRADFLTYSAYAAVDVAIEINNRECPQQPDCQMPEMVYSWKYGRTDCVSADAPNTTDPAAYNIPESKLTADEQIAYYADEFNFTELWEVVALNGVHSIGGAEANQSAHDGTFTEVNQEVALNNLYYKIMLDSDTVWEQVLSIPTEDNPSPSEWRWDGYSAVDGSRTGMKLDTDFELLYDLELDDEGLSGCTVPNGAGDLPVCPKYPSYDIAEEYANNKTKWVHNFAIVFDKMLLNKVDLGRLVDLS